MNWATAETASLLLFFGYTFGWLWKLLFVGAEAAVCGPCLNVDPGLFGKDSVHGT